MIPFNFNEEISLAIKDLHRLADNVTTLAKALQDNQKLVKEMVELISLRDVIIKEQGKLIEDLKKRVKNLESSRISLRGLDPNSGAV